MKPKLSESILQKRIKRFKSMKRGYYSLIAIIAFYIISLLGPLWINNKALVIRINDNKIINNLWNRRLIKIIFLVY